jgi:hypothetical protein
MPCRSLANRLLPHLYAPWPLASSSGNASTGRVPDPIGHALPPLTSSIFKALPSTRGTPLHRPNPSSPVSLPTPLSFALVATVAGSHRCSSFLVIWPRRSTRPQRSSPRHPLCLLSTRACPHRRHATAKPPSSMSYHAGYFLSSFRCCGALLTPSRTFRTSPECSLTSMSATVVSTFPPTPVNQPLMPPLLSVQF